MSKSSNKLTRPERVSYGLSATTIKMIAVICMFIDHIAAFVIARLIEGDIWHTQTVWFSVGIQPVRLEIAVYYLMRLVGRISFPLFCFFIVEGYLHTRSKTKYALRLLIFAVLSELQFSVALNGLGNKMSLYLMPSNVYFTLLIGLIVIWGADTLKKYAPGGFVAVCFRILVCILPTAYVAYEISSLLSISENIAQNTFLFFEVWAVLGVATLVGLFVLAAKTTKENARAVSSSLTLLSIGMIIADVLETDYASTGVLVIFLMYIFANRKKVAGTLMGVTVLTLTNFAEISAFADVWIISKYNGERGKGYKYFFYAFYPVHIAVIVVVLYLTGLI